MMTVSYLRAPKLNGWYVATIVSSSAYCFLPLVLTIGFTNSHYTVIEDEGIVTVCLETNTGTDSPVEVEVVVAELTASQANQMDLEPASGECEGNVNIVLS